MESAVTGETPERIEAPATQPYPPSWIDLVMAWVRRLVASAALLPTALWLVQRLLERLGF